MKSKFKSIFTFLFLVFSMSTAFSQYFSVLMDIKLKESNLIIEGKVIAKKSYYDKDNEIYTENLIQIENVLKGETSDSHIAIVTMGGSIDSVTSNWTHVLSLSTNQYGAFFLKDTERPVNRDSKYRQYDVFSGTQGFINI